MVYYNEIDPYCCEWLESLISERVLPLGIVDRRPIQKVHPNDLRGFTQVHLFAGIGGWAYALRLAGWPEEREVWTGSCPCQPFSIIGNWKGKEQGTKDKRHLWPYMHKLILFRRPPIVFGEQVTGKTGLEWFARMRSDMEKADYAVGAASMCALPFGTAHRRQRLYFVAHISEARLQTRGLCQKIQTYADGLKERSGFNKLFENVVPTFKWTHKPLLERGIHAIPGRVGALSGYGNAIVPPVAAEFILAAVDALGDV